MDFISKEEDIVSGVRSLPYSDDVETSGSGQSAHNSTSERWLFPGVPWCPLCLDILRQGLPDLLDMRAVVAGNKADQFLQRGRTKDGMAGRS